MSLREFIGDTEEKNVLSKAVSPDYELPALISKDETKPVVFEEVSGYPDCRVVSNLVSSRHMLAEALDTSKENIIDRISSSLDNQTECGIGEPMFEKIADKPDIKEHMPVPVFYKKKKRRYFASAMLVAEDPETEIQNVSFHRLMLQDKNRMVMRLVKRHLYDIYNKTEGDLKVAIIMGVHPAVEVAAATSYSPEMDEFELANSYMNGSLELAEVNGLKVPRDSEVVMFARIKKEEDEEGPFVDLSDTWDRIRKQPVVVVDELWMRKDPYIRILLPGKGEHKNLMGVPQEPRIYKIVKNTVPAVKNVVLTQGGCSWLHGVVQIEKRNEGDPKNAGMAALAAHPSMKKVTIVDEDIDPSDSVEVEWATATRMQPDKDILFIERAKGSSLDPSQDYENKLTTKWIVDATVPFDNKDPNEFKKARLPGKDLNLDDYR